MSREVRGQGTNTRYVRNILPETQPAEGLLVVEVITPGGHWSSYPPHKHDTATAGEETALEETYYHRLNPPQGFAFQRVYTDDRSLDETVCVEDGDVVMVPRGYHPVGAPHGYDLYYLQRHGRPEAEVDLPQRPGPRLDRPQGLILVRASQEGARMRSIAHFIGGPRRRGPVRPFRRRLRSQHRRGAGAGGAGARTASWTPPSPTPRAAQPAWAAINPQRRARVMFEFKRLLNVDMDELAHLLVERARQGRSPTPRATSSAAWR